MKNFILIPFAICLLTSILFAQGTWTQKADFGGTGRLFAVGFSLGTKGYIGTGTRNDFWEWDQTTNVWTQKATLSGTARGVAVGFSMGNKGYIGTGMYGSTNYFQDFWEWDQASDVWTQKANFIGAARGDAVGFSIGTKGYIGTGADPGNYYNDLWEWNKATNAWTQVANFGGSTRDCSVGFSIGTKGYIGTGEDAINNWEKDFWEYTPDSTSSINEPTLESLISISPNPFSSTAVIEIKDSGFRNKDFKMQMYNVNGEVVLQSQILTPKSLIERSGLPAGVYFIHLSSKDQSATKKIIIQ